MHLTARISAILTGLLASGCFFGAVRGLQALRTIADPVLRSDTKGFAGFWAFLGCVFLVIAALSWKAAPEGRA